MLFLAFALAFVFVSQLSTGLKANASGNASKRSVTCPPSWKMTSTESAYLTFLVFHAYVHVSCYNLQLFFFSSNLSLDPKFIASEPFYWRVIYGWISATVAKLRYYFAFKVGKSILCLFYL